ncbi:MAG: hypothetical protein O7F71_13870 [Gammaproteobacteria bacterium]|nr:hypothetical protein [Gammaproteobacteria bacterium]
MLESATLAYVSSNTLTKSYTTPLTLRLYESLPGNPVWIGGGFLACLLVMYFVGRVLLEGAAESSSENLRVTITQLILTAYVASAYTYLLMTARKATKDLAPVARHAPEWQTIIDRVGTHRGWVLLFVGAVSSLVIGVGATNMTTPEEAGTWHWQSWSYDTYWQRSTTVILCWWMGCLGYVIVVESIRLSRLSNMITSVDLLDLLPYRPLLRQGLTNALLVFGLVSLLSLFVVESRYGPMLVGAWTGGVIFAWISLMFPLRGIRRKIKVAKQQELDWCRLTLQKARDELKSGSGAQYSITEIAAYRSIIENVRNWPFDNSTLARFALFLLIPLGSWLGGAVVERGLDLFLSGSLDHAPQWITVLS